jgi:hypothetical protein
MKKIVLLFVLSLICVSVFAGGNQETNVFPELSYDMLQGTWIREDGATITFNGNNWETVDLVNAGAGFGTFKINNRKGIIEFIFEYVANLKIDQKDKWAKKISPDGMRVVPGKVYPKEFLLIAQAEFFRLYPDRILNSEYDPKKSWGPNGGRGWDEPPGTIGGSFRSINIEGNVLTLIQTFSLPERNYDISWLYEPFNGTFVKQ